MLILSLYGICALALTGVFFPWIKILQEPSIALLYSASTISQDCFKDFSDWLQFSTEDTGHRPSPLSSLPRIVYLPSPSSSSSSSNKIWNGTKDYIVLPTGSSLATVTQLENSLSLVTPFKVHPPNFPPPLFGHLSGSAVNNDAGETFDSEELIISNDGLPLFLGLVASVVVAFHLVVYVSWKRELAKLDRQAGEAKTIASELMEDLSKTKIVLHKTEDSYLKGVLDGLETTSKQSGTSTSSEAQISILQHLYTDGDSSSAPAPVLFSVKRWTMSNSEFESKYDAVSRVSAIGSSTVVPQLPIKESSKRKRLDSDPRSENDNKGLEIPNYNAQPATRQLDNGGNPSGFSSTVVPNLHPERLSVRKRPFVSELARRPRRPQRPPTRPIVIGRTLTTAMIDTRAEAPSDTSTTLGRRENSLCPSTTVDVRVGGAAEPNIVERIEHAIHDESAPEPAMPCVPVTETVETSATVDIQAEGVPVAKVTGAGSRTHTEDGYDSSTSVQTTILAPTTPYKAAATATATATAVEVQASPQIQTASPQTELPSGGGGRRRRRNRMGQRQRRRLREMRENHEWEAIQPSSLQQGDDEE